MESRLEVRAGICTALTFCMQLLFSALTVAQTARPTPTPTPTEQPLPHVASTEIVVRAPRMDIPLKENPAATTVVQGEALATLPKTIGAEEALRLVPGVKVDNQADGERVHMSIRGQGILTERGIRGIKVLLDGLPLNDPTGFAPDLFDVDWATVKRVEVFRGPPRRSTAVGRRRGILNIETRDGGPGPVAGDVSASAGSHGFWKVLTEVGGSDGNLNYRVSGSRMMLDGYRVHTAAAATNLYGKFNYDLKGGDRITAIVAGTNFFNENAEGLNIDQVNEDPRQPNPDALTYNEYQRTRPGDPRRDREVRGDGQLRPRLLNLRPLLAVEGVRAILRPASRLPVPGWIPAVLRSRLGRVAQERHKHRHRPRLSVDQRLSPSQPGWGRRGSCDPLGSEHLSARRGVLPARQARTLAQVERDSRFAARLDRQHAGRQPAHGWPRLVG